MGGSSHHHHALRAVVRQRDARVLPRHVAGLEYPLRGGTLRGTHRSGAARRAVDYKQWAAKALAARRGRTTADGRQRPWDAKTRVFPALSKARTSYALGFMPATSIPGEPIGIPGTPI